MNSLELKINRFLFRIDVSGRRRLWLKLAKLLNNGVPIIDAMSSLLKRRVESGGAKHPVAIALQHWIDHMRNGSRISNAISGWVDQDEQMLISAGEQSGTVGDALEATASIMEAKKKIKTAVISGLSYPVVMMCIAFSVLIMFSFKVIPEFSKVVSDDKWHGIARIMIDFADFSRNWIVVIIAVIIGLIVAFFMSLPRWSEGWRKYVDKYPPYNIYRLVNGSTWLISFASLINAGVRIENALEQMASDATPWMQNRIRACLKGMRSGLSPGDALSRSGYGFPDEEIIDDIAIYSRLSGFDNALSIIGKEWMVEGIERIQAMMKVIFGISVLFVGLFVAFMMGGLIGMELQMASIIQTSH